MNTESTIKLIADSHSNAVEHGFYDGVENNWDSIRERIMLIICEVAELMEADRKGKWYGSTSAFANDELREQVAQSESRIHTHVNFNEFYGLFVKGHAEEELADICIRIFDLLGFLDYKQINIDIVYPYKPAPCVKLMCFDMCNELIGNAVYVGLQHTLCIINDYCKRNEIDLDLHIEAKMLYNRNRPYKHGKNY